MIYVRASYFFCVDLCEINYWPKTDLISLDKIAGDSGATKRNDEHDIPTKKKKKSSL